MGKSVKKNIAYNFAYQILAVVLPLITTPYISRILGPEKVGEYSYSYAIAYYFVMFTLLGLNNYGNRSIASVRDNKELLSREFWGIYILQMSTGCIAIMAYIYFGLFILNTKMTWILLLYVISAVIDINWFFFGLEEFKITVVRNSVVKILSTIAIFVFVKNVNDVYIYALIMTIGFIVSQLVVWPFIRKYITVCKICKHDVIRHIKPNLILFIPIIAVSLYKVMDKIMLGILANTTEVGLYEASERILQIPMALVQSMGVVMLPKITNLLANNDEDTSNRYFKQSISFAVFLSSSMCFGIMGVSRYFVPLFYGPGYEKCILLYQILLPSCVFLAFANVIRTQYLIPRKLDRIFITSVIIGAIVNMAINIILIPRYASIGAAIGTLIAEMLVCVYQAIKIRKEVNIVKYSKDSLLVAIPAMVMYVILININLHFSNVINVLLLIVIGIIIYLIGALIILIIFKKNEIGEWIRNRRNK